MIIEEKDDQAMLTLMGKQAEELFGGTCQDLLSMRFYPTKQTLALGIMEKIGQTNLFEFKINNNSDLIVCNILGNPAPFEHSNVLKSVHSQEKKQSSESCTRTLFLYESEKKSKTQMMKNHHRQCLHSSKSKRRKRKIDPVSITKLLLFELSSFYISMAVSS